tara:strand:+ start:1315 stop:1536 length:222 start_codon:yes stop_codon:yes gene_type:complete
MSKYNLDHIIQRIREEMSISAGGGAGFKGTAKTDSGSPTAGLDKPLGKKYATGGRGSRKRWLDYVRGSKAKGS